MPVDPVDAALSRVQAYCRWHVAPVHTDEVLTLDGSGRSIQFLPSLLVSGVASVVNDGVTLVEGTDFAWSAAGWLGMLDPTAVFSDLPRSVVVTLTHGYTAMPDEVQQVIERVAARPDMGAVQQVGQVRYGTSPVGVGVGGSLTDFDKADLMPYRIPLVR